MPLTFPAHASHHQGMRLALVFIVSMVLTTALTGPASAASKHESSSQMEDSITCSLTLNYPHQSTGSPGKIDAKGTFKCSAKINAVIYTKLTYKKNGTTTTAATSTETRSAGLTSATYYVPRLGATLPACVSGAVYTAYASISYGGLLDEALVTNPSTLC